MDGINIELVDESGGVLAGPKAFLEVAASFLAALPVESRAENRQRLILLNVPGDGNDLPGEPALSYESPQFGYVYVSIKHDDRALYRHPHTVGEVVEAGLREWMKTLELPRPVTGYRLVGAGILTVRPTPQIEGVAAIKPYGAGESPSFRIRPMSEPRLSEATLPALGGEAVSPDWLRAGRTGLVKVVVDPAVHEELLARSFSKDVEEGGFLVGNVFEDGDRADTFLVRVTGAPMAKNTGASLLHFTFTGDSFREVNRLLGADGSGARIVGWYHTHLFAASDDMGLSSIDVRLHATTFRIPWQLAGLVNLEKNGRVVRFYVREKSSMALCHHQIASTVTGAGQP